MAETTNKTEGRKSVLNNSAAGAPINQLQVDDTTERREGEEAQLLQQENEGRCSRLSSNKEVDSTLSQNQIQMQATNPATVALNLS